MAISINVNELHELLDTMPAEQNIMLAGKHGIGKSRILTDYFEAKGFKVVSLFLGQMSDPGDLIGLPNRSSDGSSTTFLPPYWFPQDNTPVVLFLDELNRARPEVLQCIMDLALNKTLAGRPLPEGSRVISAVNEGDEYQLTDLDPALISRFNIYTFRPSPKEWLKWAEEKGLDERVIGFIASDPVMLDGGTERLDEGDIEKTADRRGWEKVSDFIKPLGKMEEVHKKIMAGIIGVKATAAFFQYLSKEKMVGPLDILSNFSSVKNKMKKYDLPQFAMINDAIFRYLDGNVDSSFDVEKNLMDYLAFLEAEKMTEAVAQFTSNITENNYKKAVAYIVKNARKVFDHCIEFVTKL